MHRAASPAVGGLICVFNLSVHAVTAVNLAVDGVEFEQGEPTLFAVLRAIRSSNCGVGMSIVISRMRSDVLAPTLQALALLAGAVTLIHALGVWARS
ncbi:hypothetical protein CDL16_17715 [Pseudomonas aeruginosa]|nr:hypothetical protein CDL16_17715 [Pseudomonas aeruginosa]